MKPIKVCFTLGLLTALACPAGAQIIISSTDDTTIQANLPNTPTPSGENGFNNADALFSGRRTLAHFDVSSLGSSVAAATLSLTPLDSPSNRDFQIAPLTKDWTVAGATWNSAVDGTTVWTTPGGDYGPVINYNPGTGAFSADVTSIVNGWLSGATPNYGLILISTNPTTRFAFFAQESGNPMQLTTVVPEPSTYALIIGTACLGFVVWRKRRQAKELVD